MGNVMLYFISYKENNRQNGIWTAFIIELTHAVIINLNRYMQLSLYLYPI